MTVRVDEMVRVIRLVCCLLHIPGPGFRVRVRYRIRIRELQLRLVMELGAKMGVMH